MGPDPNSYYMPEPVSSDLGITLGSPKWVNTPHYFGNPVLFLSIHKKYSFSISVIFSIYSPSQFSFTVNRFKAFF